MRPMCDKWISLIIMSVCVAGCSNAENEATLRQSSNMRSLAIAYGQFTSQNRGRPPRNEEQLRKFIESQPGFVNPDESASIDEIFISSRDGKPYVVRYGKSAHIVAYEQEGVDGMRMVATQVGGTEEMDEATLRQAVPDAE